MMNTENNNISEIVPENSDPGWWDIARVYLKIGTIGFGGGFAVMNLIHAELVEKRPWLAEQRYQNMVALSEMAPGALTVNLLSGIAYRLGGLRTMIVATIALILPSFVLITLLTGAFLAWQDNPLVKGALEGLTAGVIGLLLAVVWSMIKQAPKHWCCFAVGLLALVLGFLLPINPIWLVLMGGAAGAMKVVVEHLRSRNMNPTSNDSGA